MKPDRVERESLIDSLEVGDLIRINDLKRVVRDVRRRRGKVTHITLSIQRCTWTRRPYTVKNRTDLYLCRLDVVTKGYGVGRTELEAMLQKDISDHNLQLLHCGDVKGRVK